MRRAKNTWVEWINVYQFDKQNFPVSSEVWNLVEKFRELSDVFNDFGKNNREVWISEKKNIPESLKTEIKDVQTKIDSIFETYESSLERNILKLSNLNDLRIWNWKDSRVYPHSKNYVYKEGKVCLPENVLFLKNKYLLLKKYLGAIIPKSAFIYWESMIKIDSSIKKYRNKRIPQNIALTLQKRIKWVNLSEMTFTEKEDKLFLKKLAEAHRKYVLLKIFLRKIQNELNLSNESMELKLDLWVLSDQDSIDIQNIDLPSLNSPNIMWDWKNIFFIDFDFWIWDDDKQKIFNKMQEPKVINDWKKILEIYNIEHKTF